MADMLIDLCIYMCINICFLIYMCLCICMCEYMCMNVYVYMFFFLIAEYFCFTELKNILQRGSVYKCFSSTSFSNEVKEWCTL